VNEGPLGNDIRVPRKELESVKVMSDCMPGRCQTSVVQSTLSEMGMSRSKSG
jgi:hypothetical protein